MLPTPPEADALALAPASDALPVDRVALARLYGEPLFRMPLCCCLR